MSLKDTLADTLKSIADNSGDALLCKFGRIYKNMDKDTQNALRSAMNSSASTMDICRALNDDGIKIRREFLGEKRKCFSSTSTASACCLNSESSGPK
jgi:hypothetical protein